MPCSGSSSSEIASTLPLPATPTMTAMASSRRSSGLMPPESLFVGCNRLPVSTSHRLARRRRRRQDRGEQRHDRSGRRRSRRGLCTKFRWASNGSWPACWTASWVLAARRAPAPPSTGSTAARGRPTRIGIVPALLSAEITARSGRDPGEAYRALTREFGAPRRESCRCAGDAEQKKKLGKLDRQQVRITELARRADRSDFDPGARQRCADRRRQSHLAERLVRGAPVGHREHLQDLCREFSRRGPSAPPDRGRPVASWMRRSPAPEPAIPRLSDTAKRLLPWLVAVGLLHGIAGHDHPQHGGADDCAGAQGPCRSA